RIFKWAMGSQIYELVRSPFENLSPAILIGKKKPRKRVLNDAEIAACWRACEVLGYPYGPLIRLLLLTGARRDEVGEAGWPEFNLDKGVWTIPPDRFKPDREHVVPLSADSVTVLQNLPRFAGGHFLFTTKSGRCPVNGYSKAKLRLDAAMG